MPQTQKNAAGVSRFAPAQFSERIAKRFHAEILLAGGALHSIKKGADIDQFGAILHEIKIKDLLTGHSGNKCIGFWKLLNRAVRWFLKTTIPATIQIRETVGNTKAIMPAFQRVLAQERLIPWASTLYLYALSH